MPVVFLGEPRPALVCYFRWEDERRWEALKGVWEHLLTPKKGSRQGSWMSVALRQLPRHRPACVLESWFCKLRVSENIRVTTPSCWMTQAHLRKPSHLAQHCLRLLHLHQRAALLGPTPWEEPHCRAREAGFTSGALGCQTPSLEHLDPRCAAEVTREKAGRLWIQEAASCCTPHLYFWK